MMTLDFSRPFRSQDRGGGGRRGRAGNARIKNRHHYTLQLNLQVFGVPVFSLIITIISIALTAALAVATVFYGGQIFADQSLKADASRIISQGQQMRAAFALAEADGLAASGPTDLAPTYLREVPSAPEGIWGDALRPRFNMMAAQPKSAKLCQKINEAAGVKASDTADTTDVDSALVALMSADDEYLSAKFAFFCARVGPRYAVVFGTL